MNIGARLREERKRLGLDQAAFGGIGGVKALAQVNYEAGRRVPDATYLAAVAGSGVDVLYVLTGQRALSEQQLEDGLRRYADAWQLLDAALTKFKRTLPADKKRKAVDALYRASKGKNGIDEQQLTLVLDLAA